ncbi:MAG: hypothetical protein SP1CHLAM54_04610 [Chlamydiia bacterium]|nr:hypothetical protein [Chlamydiia bacterium]MCH9615373.1 hypothetical protein [Chlamydiia bacterium]MCH9628305.1 hypothetical protein [Chlamydiia bacterium]
MVAALLTAIVKTAFLSASTPQITPPPSWRILPPKKDHPVKIGFLANERNYPPSMNLAFEECPLTVDEYVTRVKERTMRNPEKTYRDLGSIQTRAGIGRLVQIDSKSPHGVFHVVQCFVRSEKGIHLITSALHEKHFMSYLSTIKKSMETFEITNVLFDDNSPLAEKIQTMIAAKGTAPKKIKQLNKFLKKNYPEKGIYWHLLVLTKFQKQLRENSPLQ